MNDHDAKAFGRAYRAAVAFGTERAAPSEPRTVLVTALRRALDDRWPLTGRIMAPIDAYVATERAEAARLALDGVRRAVEGLDDPWPVEGAKDDDPRDDWCRKRDVLAAIGEASRD